MREGVGHLADAPNSVADPRETVDLLLRELRARPDGLSSREAERRLVAHGRNELVRRGGVRWPRQLLKQFTHDPAWSPDGRTIAFVRYPSAHSRTGDIWLANATGGGLKLLVRNAMQPAWKRG